MDIDRKPEALFTEFAKFGFFEDSLRIEGLHAKFDRHEFATHAHDTWAIGAVVSGAKDISARRGAKQVVSIGECYSLPPYRPHAGKSVADHCEYVMLYVPDAEWREQCEVYGVDPALFLSAVPKQPLLARQLASFVSLVLRHPDMLSKWAGEWAVFCETILSPYSHVQSVRSSAALSRVSRDPAILRAHDYLREFWDKNVSLTELAREASMSTYELCRRFSAVYGLTPHRYQLVLRVMNAKSKLLQGAGISEVASDTGFSDQSHLGRHFKSVFGLTPGSVVREVARARGK
ncbi:AraC-like protein [Paraburkholderia sp. BL6669N2]|uniref:helix-turn-helix domain-containing protein n=1 Tax=Paraburkholderia sp. BL6669N2 TaxID=1938807 RepID=UPI000E2370F2|nr:AraC family transcriptional regulator [Paraburkholderia sp. BL6669N2]REG49588.1 AraC-like protein [Paraburkholderia sp. BL6669N2]